METKTDKLQSYLHSIYTGQKENFFMYTIKNSNIRPES
jgi:hypothetical protein